MQFLILGYDGTDTAAKERRLTARPAHLALGNTMRANSQLAFAAALLDETGGMNGSMMVVDFPDRAALDAWLKEEPYVTGRVWERTEVAPCTIAPAFEHIAKVKES
jgi:uncharacterized protein YciI